MAEPNETFVVNLSGPVGLNAASASTSATGQATIMNDDSRRRWTR